MSYIPSSNLRLLEFECEMAFFERLWHLGNCSQESRNGPVRSHCHFGTFFLLLLLLLLICKWLLIRDLPAENGTLVPCLPLLHDVLCSLKPQPKTNISSLMLRVPDILSQR